MRVTGLSHWLVATSMRKALEQCTDTSVIHTVLAQARRYGLPLSIHHATKHNTTSTHFADHTVQVQIAMKEQVTAAAAAHKPPAEPM